jgi:hypothetical protein
VPVSRYYTNCPLLLLLFVFDIKILRAKKVPWLGLKVRDIGTKAELETNDIEALNCQ